MIRGICQKKKLGKNNPKIYRFWKIEKIRPLDKKTQNDQKIKTWQKKIGREKWHQKYIKNWQNDTKNSKKLPKIIKKKW